MCIAVIGDIIDDEYWHGRTNRISPEAPIPVVTDVQKSIRMGGAGNVYQNLCSLTDSVFLYESKSIKPHKLRIFIDNYLITRIDTESYQPVDVDISSLPENTRFCILSDYNKGMLHHSQSIIEKLNEKGILTIVDPKKKFEEYKNCWLIKANKKELENEVNANFDDINIEECLRIISSKHNIPNIIVTNGGGPLFFYNSCSNIFKEYPTKKSNVIDVTGAGDVFIAVLTYLLSSGQKLEETIEIANKAATLSVSKLGTYTITKDDLNDCIH